MRLPPNPCGQIGHGGERPSQGVRFARNLISEVALRALRAIQSIENSSRCAPPRAVCTASSVRRTPVFTMSLAAPLDLGVRDFPAAGAGCAVRGSAYDA